MKGRTKRIVRAPFACIICGKTLQPPEDQASSTWLKLSKTRPKGTLVCSDACQHKAFWRLRHSGRVDR